MSSHKQSFTIPGNPQPKGRPRVDWSGHVYTPGSTRAWENVVSLHSPQLGPRRGPVGLRLRFYRRTRRKVDLDNLIKAVMDGMRGKIYRDDYQVVRLEAALLYDRDAPRVEVEVWKEE